MLIESVLLLLIEKGAVQKDDALEAIEGIIEIKQEIAGKTESVVVSIASIGLLRAVSASLHAAVAPAGQVAP